MVLLNRRKKNVSVNFQIHLVILKTTVEMLYVYSFIAPNISTCNVRKENQENQVST